MKENSEPPKSTNGPGVDIHYWPRSFLLRATGFEQPFREKPYQRLAATVVVASESVFELQVAGEPTIEASAVLLGPKTRRQALRLPPSGSFMLDAGIGHRLFRGLCRQLRGASLQVLDEQQAGKLADLLVGQGSGTWSCTQARAVFERTLDLVAGNAAEQADIDERVTAVLERIDTLPRDVVRVADLARQVSLSESRLRSLVQKHLGCSLASYLRWAAAWKTALGWQPGLTLTQAAVDAGFHDLAHATHTFNELFGLPPSRLLDTDTVALHPCEG